jgi:hypothetical protein
VQAHSLKHFELKDGGPLPSVLKRGFLIELAILTLEGGTGTEAPDFFAVGSWLSRQQLLSGSVLSRRAQDGQACNDSWKVWKAVRKGRSEPKMAAALCREWLPYKEMTHSKSKLKTSVTQSEFDSRFSQRSVQKLALRLSRTQAEAEAKVRVINRTVKQLSNERVKSKMLEASIEKMRATVAKLKVDVIGSPKVRQALRAANEASARAEVSEAELKEANRLLASAVQNLDGVERDHQNECMLYLRRVGALKTQLSKAEQRASAAEKSSERWQIKSEYWKLEYEREKEKRLAAESELAELVEWKQMSQEAHADHQRNAANAYATALAKTKEHCSEQLQNAAEARQLTSARAIAAEARVQELTTRHRPLEKEIKKQSAQITVHASAIRRLDSELAEEKKSTTRATKIAVQAQMHQHQHLLTTQELIVEGEKATAALSKSKEVSAAALAKSVQTAAAEQQQLQVDCDAKLERQENRFRKKSKTIEEEKEVVLKRAVGAEKRVRVLQHDLNHVHAKNVKLSEQMQQDHEVAVASAIKSLQLQADVAWVGGRRESFITVENLQASAFKDDRRALCSALKSWKVQPIKIKSSCLFTMPEREQCYEFIKNKLESSSDGVIEVKAAGAVRSIQLCQIPKAIVSSEAGSTATLKRRNAVIDTVFRMLCGKAGATDGERKAAVINQLAAHMKRHKAKDLYKPAMEKAGIRAHGVLTVENTAVLRNSMSDNLWRFVKSYLDKEAGIKSASAARVKKFTEPTQLPMVMFTGVNSRGQKGSWVRVESGIAALRHQVAMHQKRGNVHYPANVPANECWFHWQFDKGTDTTKIVSKLIIIGEADSVDNVILLGIFSGMKDDHEGLKMAFGSLFEEYDEIMNGEEGTFIEGLLFKRVKQPARFLQMLAPNHPAHALPLPPMPLKERKKISKSHLYKISKEEYAEMQRKNC